MLLSHPSVRGGCRAGNPTKICNWPSFIEHSYNLRRINIFFYMSPALLRERVMVVCRLCKNRDFLKKLIYQLCKKICVSLVEILRESKLNTNTHFFYIIPSHVFTTNLSLFRIKATCRESWRFLHRTLCLFPASSRRVFLEKDLRKIMSWMMFIIILLIWTQNLQTANND